MEADGLFTVSPRARPRPSRHSGDYGREYATHSRPHLTYPLAPIDLADTPNIGAFLVGLRPYADRTLVFAYDGRRIRPSYHVTEIKAAYHTLDCRGNLESWTEAIIQL